MIENNEPDVAPLVRDLGEQLRESGVLFCHWKSNASIDLAEQGATDLDLLFAADQKEQFAGVMTRCGFIAAERPGAGNFPGMTHFFGYDSKTDRLIHVHAHDQLVVGHDRTKNFRIPIEEPFLASASQRFPMPLPSPEFEYVVLCLRMVLKYAVLDEVLWAKARGRTAGPSPSERAEFDHLHGLVDQSEVEAIVHTHLPFVGVELFRRCESFVSHGARASQRAALARDLHTALEDHARATPARDASRRVVGRVRMAARRRSGRSRKFIPADGGALIAILGGDGAGKSTALEELRRWLAGPFDVVAVHLGKPPWSLTSYVLRGVLKLMALVAGAGNGDWGVVTPVDTDSAPGDQRLSFPVVRRMLWFASKSRDRYLAYRKARAATDSGWIVISDRFTHPALSTMDTPQIALLSAGYRQSRLVEMLAAIENHYHSKVGEPDLTAVLLLEPAEAARRKTDEPSDYVIRRSAEVWEVDWDAEDVSVVDASRPPETVAAELKSYIWGYLTSRSDS